MTTVIDIAPDQIRPSPFNHRKNFTGLDELGASLLEKGMINPVTARPTPGGKLADEPYELVAGERRWRAATKVGLDKIPVIVRELTDKEVIEVQLIENVQRVDVHPLEEADGYKELIDKHGYDVDGIAAKTGKSKAYVYARMKLCDLTGKHAREAFLEDKVNASIALLAARIPVPKLQDAFIKRCVAGENDNEWVHGERVSVQRALSFREAQLLAQKEFMLRLENAPFPIVDDKLVKGVGSCVGCLFRTGNQRELFDDVKSADVCTNPPCFEKKKNAQAEREVTAWKAEGGKVLAKSEAPKVFQEYYGGKIGIRYGSAYADAEDKAPFDVDRKQRTWKQLFGDEPIPVVLAVDDTGKKWTLVHKANAVKALQKSGVLKEKKASSSSSHGKSSKPKPPTEGELIEQRALKKLLEAFAEKLEPKLAKGDIETWKWLATWAIEFACIGEAYFPLKQVAGIRDKSVIGYHDSTKALTKKLFEPKATAEYMRRLLVMAAIADRLGGDTSTKNYDKVCKPFGVDYKKIALAAADEVRAELAKAKADAGDKKPAKKRKAA